MDPVKKKLFLQGKYGLGDRRSFEQLVEFSGIDTKNQKILGNRCGNLELVPFKEHPWGADYIPQFDSVTDEYMDVRDPGSIYFDNTTESFAKWSAAHKENTVSIRKMLEESSVQAITNVYSFNGNTSSTQFDMTLLTLISAVVLVVFYNIFCSRRCHVGKHSRLSDSLSDGLNTAIKTI